MLFSSLLSVVEPFALVKVYHYDELRPAYFGQGQFVYDYFYLWERSSLSLPVHCVGSGYDEETKRNYLMIELE